MRFDRAHRRLSSSDAVLPTTDTFFRFDGTNSDLARQLYLRAEAGGSVPKFTSFNVPDSLQKRLNDLNVKWDELSGIAQRAVLWDSGFGVTVDDKAVQIWPLSGHSMTDLAVPLEQFQVVGCEEMNCTQPNDRKSLSNLYCNGDQMLNASRCVMDHFKDPVDIHGPMWMTGDNPEVIPTPRVRNHDWTDDYSKIHYTVLAVHTVEADNEPTYGECATENQNEGYGSLVLSCYSTEELPAAIANQREEVLGSPWVSRWLTDEFSANGKAKSNDGLKKILIVPIIVGILVIVALVAIFFCLKRKRQKTTENGDLQDSLMDMETYQPHNFKDKEEVAPDRDFAPNGSFAVTLDDTLSVSHRGVDKTIKFMSSTSSASDFSSGSNNTLKILLDSEFLIGKRLPYESLVLKKSISKGACGEVWVGEFQGQEIAVKRLLQAKAIRADEVESFAQEIELSASLVHPNIVSFIGVAWNSLNNLVMAMEFFPMGDLQAYLTHNADLMSWTKDKIPIAVGVGRALEYIHSRSTPLIHRDLKSKNILLTRMLEAKLIDFGVSRDRQEYSMTAGVGTPYWTAPEILEGKRYTEQADMYSFGVVLSELDTGKIPYYDVLTSEGKKQKPFQILTEVMSGMLRPSFSENCPSRIRRIGVTCCQHDPSKRPTAAQVVKMLEEL